MPDTQRVRVYGGCSTYVKEILSLRVRDSTVIEEKQYLLVSAVLCRMLITCLQVLIGTRTLSDCVLMLNGTIRI